jgi:PhzF family phenazine biosynthesis protein
MHYTSKRLQKKLLSRPRNILDFSNYYDIFFIHKENKMRLKIYQVDAFTIGDRSFTGNPAAICPLEEWLDEATMLKIAAENNLSETAFFVKKDEKFELKWFTPKIEVDLCGHATLASAHVIFNFLGYKKKEIKFSTLSGELRVTRKDNLVTLDFPVSKGAPVHPMPVLAEALGKSPLEIYKSRDYLALFDNEEDILSIEPDFALLNRLDCLGIMVTAQGNSSDFVSRFFAPQAGVNEDPVTGSAHTSLIPFWSERLQKKSLHAFQLSERRGELFCEDCGDRVKISGRAVTFMTGEIKIP